MPTMTLQEWKAEAVRRFGRDPSAWRFRCPACGHTASVAEYRSAGAPVGAIGFSCIGRYLVACRDAFGEKGPGPCNYAGGGLFRLNPVSVEGKQMMEFASPEIPATDAVPIKAPNRRNTLRELSDEVLIERAIKQRRKVLRTGKGFRTLAAIKAELASRPTTGQDIEGSSRCVDLCVWDAIVAASTDGDHG